MFSIFFPFVYAQGFYFLDLCLDFMLVILIKLVSELNHRLISHLFLDGSSQSWESQIPLLIINCSYFFHFQVSDYDCNMPSNFFSRFFRKGLV